MGERRAMIGEGWPAKVRRAIGALLSWRGRLDGRGVRNHLLKAGIWSFGLITLGLLQVYFANWLAPRPMVASVGFGVLFLFFAFSLAAAVCWFGGLIAAGIRRCHDAGLAGWWALLILPLLLPGEEEANAYGPPPASSQPNKGPRP